MMEPTAMEDAKKACLKQSFGGALDDREQELLTTFLATEEGQRYMTESNEMKGLLSDVAYVEPIDSAQMVADFEAMVRARLQTTRRTIPWALLCTSGLWTVLGILMLTTAGPQFRVLGLSLLALAAFFVVCWIAIWRKQVSLLAADDLIAHLESDKQLARVSSVRIYNFAIACAALSVLGYAVAQVSGTTGVLFWAIGSAALFYLFFRRQRALKRRDQKLWDWWEGR
ncbi:MAG: hypothetical protein VYE77_01875 [Planctomycetota bacterium]|nr:hypothetical protein [Planctomycetota bacterium]